MARKDKKRRMNAMLTAAEREIALFKRSKRWVNLSQACEKTWVAFTLLLELKTNREIRTTKGLHETARVAGLSNLFSLCHNLHIIHYEGSPDLDEDIAVQEVESRIADIRYAAGWENG